MRKVVGILLTAILMFASVGSAFAGGSGEVPKTDTSPVPVVAPINTGASAPGPQEVGLMTACSNTVTGVTQNPLSYSSWSTVTQFQACSSLTVKVYNIGPGNSVVVRVLDTNLNELSPRVKWDPGVNEGWTYTWSVGPGTYTVQASAYNCCTSTSATFDVWTN